MNVNFFQIALAMAMDQDQVLNLSAKIVDFKLSEDEIDNTKLVQVGPDSFPIQTSVQKVELEAGKSVTIVKSW